MLLESSDYHGSENSVSYICCQPIAGIEVNNGTIILSYPDGTSNKKEATKESVIPTLIEFTQSFELESTDHKFASSGLFGYMGYDAVQYFEDVEIQNDNSDFEIPEIIYQVYRYVIAIDHFKNEMHLFEHRWDMAKPSELDELLNVFAVTKGFVRGAFRGVRKRRFRRIFFQTVNAVNSCRGRIDQYLMILTQIDS